MTATLRDKATEAAAESNARVKDSARENRERTLDKVLASWDEKYYGTGHKLGGVAAPTRDAFSYCRVRTDGRTSEVYGWRCEIDGVPILTVKNGAGDDGAYVIVTCPDCGAERAESFHDLASLGRLLNAGRGTIHHCRDKEAREVAYAIGSAARDAKVSAAEIIDLALENHSDLIYRLTAGR